MKRITVHATGNVQGVGYRFFVTGCARDTGVRGYVRNREDGSVEVVAEGSEPDLEEFARLLWAKKDDIIRVTGLRVTWEEPTEEFSGFGIRW